ncbi:hypothetical protein DID88_009808 [Monilinia fructigena]|uniref:Aminoglycoside phosphotransferase domain-containing protein n=1 Tax=Monilinia fructigena TaxID=38457 RepID=A0A395ICZ7_9HELO|nr:hypothetical protein DID88_009808 [Monilinia fructigena]
MAGSIRQPIDLQALEKYIEKHVPEIKIPIEIKQFGFGQSNPTYQLLAANGQKYVIRKKPPGKLVSKTAHQKREEMWHDAIRTLAKLHRVNISEAGLTSFGKPAGFYDRQIKTFGTISEAQASTVDIETKEPVGQIPHIEEILLFFRDKKSQPKDRGTLVHGDYKIDNLVFHKTEPKVIGILEYVFLLHIKNHSSSYIKKPELTPPPPQLGMSTIGHPLSDIINILSPYSVQYEKKFDSLPQFQEDHLPGLPSQSDLISWYRETAGWDPEPDLPWGVAFGFFRNTCIYQGIAARWAVRQASSAKAEVHAKARWPMGNLCWKFVGLAKERKGVREKAKL